MKKFIPLFLILIIISYGIYSSLKKKIENLPSPIFNKK